MKILNWTHYDLDGIVSYINVKWAFEGHDVKLETTSPQEFRKDLTKWLEENSLDDYDHVYITDLDVADSYDLIDKSNVIVIDHHSSHVDNMPKYSNMNNIVRVETSCAKMMYQHFNKDLGINYSAAQKKLILLTDDYDQYALKIPESLMLNTVFWSLNITTRFETFTKMFHDGFNGWSPQQEAIIDVFNKELKNLIKSLEIFEADITLQGKKRKVLSTFVNTKINEIAIHLLKDIGADIAIVVNLKSKHISFRAHKEDESIDLSKIAAKLAGGGGHKTSAGGVITDDFMKFTKLFNKVSG